MSEGRRIKRSVLRPSSVSGELLTRLDVGKAGDASLKGAQALENRINIQAQSPRNANRSLASQGSLTRPNIIGICGLTIGPAKVSA